MNEVVTMENVSDEIRDFIIENFLFGNQDNITAPDESFMENGIIDSLGIMELIEHCEDTYGITIEDDELIPENLDSLSNISKFVMKKK